MNRRAFVLGAAMILLASLVAVALRAYAEATFLKAYGAAQAPWLLIATAAGFAVATLGYDALTRVAYAGVIDLGLLVVLGVVAAASPQLLARGTPPVVIVIALTAASQVANLALWNRVAASVAGRDARRMLPRAGAAVTLGGAIAGLSAGVVIPRLGLAALPYAGAGITVIVLAVCIAQERALVAGGAPGGVQVAAPAVALSRIQRSLVAALIAVAGGRGRDHDRDRSAVPLRREAALRGSSRRRARAVLRRHERDPVRAANLGGAAHAGHAQHAVHRGDPSARRDPLVLGFAIAPGFVAIAGTRTADQVLRLATSRTSQELELSAVPPAPRARWKVLFAA